MNSPINPPTPRAPSGPLRRPLQAPWAGRWANGPLHPTARCFAYPSSPSARSLSKIRRPRTHEAAARAERSHGAVPLPRARRAPRRLRGRRGQEAPRSQPRLPSQVLLRRASGRHRRLRRVAAPAQAGHLPLARGRRGGQEGVQDEDPQGAPLDSFLPPSSRAP